MKRLPHFVLPVLLLPGCGGSGAYVIEPAPLPPAAAAGPGTIYVAPFADARKSMQVHKGRTDWEDVFLDTAGRTSLAKAWLPFKRGNLGLLWQRQLAQEMSALGYSVIAAPEPRPRAEALSQAAAVGAAFLMEGEIRKLRIDKRGHDALLGTNFSGTDYTFRSEAAFRLLAVADGAVPLEKSAAFTRAYYNPERLGASDRETFPHYFSRGLPEAARALAADPGLRRLAGLPELTPTPSPTPTPEAAPPKPGETPTPAPTALPAPTPEGPYWVCPKDWKRMDPSWDICPFDGTKRKDFILKRGK